MSSETRVRTATVMDLPDIIHLSTYTFIEKCRHPAASVSGLVQAFENHPDWQWVAERGGQIVGFCSCGPRPESKRGVIQLIGVSPIAMGMGVGGKLLEVFEKASLERGCEAVRLGTPYAKSFYEKYGYTCVKVTEKFIVQLVGRALSSLGDRTLAPIQQEDIKPLLERLPEDKRIFFLTEFYKNYDLGFAFQVVEAGKAMGCGVLSRVDLDDARLPQGIPGVLTLTFHHTFDGLTLKSLLEASMVEAVRHAGFCLGIAPGQDAELKALLSELDFVPGDRPGYQPMYFMEKPLK